MNIGEAIKEVRESRGVSIQDLALRTGVSIPFLYHIESGNRNPSQDTIDKISIVLKFPVGLFYVLAMEPKDDEGEKFYELEVELKERVRFYLLTNKVNISN